MASTIENLYLKYCSRVERGLENDAYYQYLLELVAGGKTTVTQINRVLDKIVDEKWLEAIENALPAIHEIIARPRRFLKTTETIAPVEQVKKISSDTVRHLASHTQYITGMRGGMVYPGKLLTVENEESVDLYENRFINTLIRKLGEFIEKRTGAIFWDTGDEEMSILRMESTIEDDYESIEYRLDMTVRNKQTYLENDTSKIEVFKRIDRVRRMVSDFKSSTFMALMAETAPVRSPIQRTNQIVKNPDYRKCYDLWQFLERYDQVGYTVDVRETALDFDEDYLFQMYGNLALNYVVFKSLLEKDNRRITEQPRRRKTVKPKFVKQIVEEFVDDYDIPDVEIRQVIIEEVTKAQLEIERRAREKEQARIAREKEKEKERAAKEKEKERARLQAEKEKEKAKLQAQKEKEQAKAAALREKEREKAKAAALREKEKAKLQAQKEKEKAKAAALREKEREKAKAAALREKEKAKLQAQKEKEREKAKALAQKEKEKAKAAALREKEREKAKAAAQKTPEKPNSQSSGQKGGASKTSSTGKTAGKPDSKPKTAVSKPVPATEPSAAEEKVPAAAPAEERAPQAAPVLAVPPEQAPPEPAVTEAVPGNNDGADAAGEPEAPDPEEPAMPDPEPAESPEEPAIPAEEPGAAASSPPEPAAPVAGEASASPAEEPAGEKTTGGNAILNWVRRRRKK